jgi:hypothetical protein
MFTTACHIFENLSPLNGEGKGKGEVTPSASLSTIACRHMPNTFLTLVLDE